jgi:hypothetical protein
MSALRPSATLPLIVAGRATSSGVAVLIAPPGCTLAQKHEEPSHGAGSEG